MQITEAMTEISMEIPQKAKTKLSYAVTVFLDVHAKDSLFHHRETSMATFASVTSAPYLQWTSIRL